MEPVYSTVITVARAMFAAQGLRFTLTGTEHIPRSGGALLVMNHVGFFDFTYAELAARPAKRYVRFMAKTEVFAYPVAGALMRGMHHISVDRMAGTGSFATAVQALCAGELVGVFPEATISSSFELKAFKSGAARMALEAGVPLLPTIIWGSQRVWTKRQPVHLGHTRTPITVDVGAPVAPVGSALELTKTMHAQMSEQLARAQHTYPSGHPAGAFWVPARLGGGAPTPEQAHEQDRADTRGQVAKRREKMRRRAG